MKAKLETEFVELATVNSALIFHRGNQSALSVELGVARNTVKSYINKGGNQWLRVIRDGSAIAGLTQLKDKLSDNDVVVVLLHDHGSRYIAKVYNDEWMKSVGFL